MIRPYLKNPFYWQYHNQPVLLLGGSVEDNLFQIDGLEAELDTLVAAGGNYIRCTMSSRDPGDVWPFARDHTGAAYDLDKPNEAYWHRFAQLMQLTHERQVVVQIEVWDRFDFAREPWQLNPFNPKNTSSYSAEASGLPEEIKTHPGRKENPFFRSVPTLENNQLLLTYQHYFVDQLLSHSLSYDHLLFCIDNETNESPAWPAYWAQYIKERAATQQVYVTEMWDAWDLADPQHNATFDHPERYDFVDLSQNNHQAGLAHWQNPLEIRKRLQRSGVRPMNSVKIYGANSGNYGSHRDAQERFWRLILAGFAAARFHRPPSGLGLSELAQSHLKAMRMFTGRYDIFKGEPRLDLLSQRSWNEAYCNAQEGVAYAVFFPDGGDVRLSVDAVSLSLQWLDIRATNWLAEETHEAVAGQLRVQTPREEGYWLALVQVRS